MSRWSDNLDDYEITAITRGGGIIPTTIIQNLKKIKQINLFPIVNKQVISNKIPILDLRKKIFTN